MGLKDRFAESYAKSKTMSGPEKRANEIMGKLLMKKAIIPIVCSVITRMISNPSSPKPQATAVFRKS